MLKPILLLLPLISLPLSTQAESLPSSNAPFVESMGIRVGGYGFREASSASEESASTTGWQACRMNGIGIFANKGMGKNFFLEAGFDTYFNDSLVVAESMSSYDTPLDRKSALLSVAAGARFYTDSLISPYLQLGVGAELTHVALPLLNLETSALLPLGFFGAGATINISESAKLGAVFRVNAMGYYNDSQFQTELNPEMELATQGQFYASFAL